jgi:hypothetical protein
MSVKVQAVLGILLGLAGMIFNNVKRQRVNSSSQGFNLNIKLRLKLQKFTATEPQQSAKVEPYHTFQKLTFFICGSLTNNSSFKKFKRGAH